MKRLFLDTNIVIDALLRTGELRDSCGAYYAVTLSDGREGSTHYTVKSNPSYDYKSQKQDRVEYYSHYITIGSQDYFFRM